LRAPRLISPPVRIGDCGNAVAAADRDGGGDDLQNQLCPRRQTEGIVERAGGGTMIPPMTK
jgi:hypothetical protein